MMEIPLILVLISLGLFVGIASGLLGIGGGGILVPAFTTLFLHFNLPKENVLHLALGSSMACILFTSFSSMRAHQRNNNVVWQLVKVMAPFIILGTFLSTFLASYLSSKVLSMIFAAFMSYIALKMTLPKKTSVSSHQATNAELRAVSMGIGAISALVSIGGGAVTVPYLTWRNIDVKKSIGTSAALGLPISIAGTLGYLVNGLTSNIHTSLQYTYGYIYLPALIFVAIPSFIVAPLGAKLTQTLPTNRIKMLFAILLIALSSKMLISIFY
jgi:uncharacterized membrane protein YfcA